eukprot:scaffold2324_cov163-Ochromonas_danica.AAC.21
MTAHDSSVAAQARNAFSQNKLLSLVESTNKNKRDVHLESSATSCTFWHLADSSRWTCSSNRSEIVDNDRWPEEMQTTMC